MNKHLWRFGSLILICALTAWPLYAHAAVPKSLGRFTYWETYQMNEGQQPVCYMSITADPPQKAKKTKSKRRGEVVLMITHRPMEGAVDVVSYSPGGKFKSSNDVKAQIGSKAFSLFSQTDTAWARDAATDRALTMALRAGEEVVFTGTLASGEALADKVSLKGSSKAYETISKACGVEVVPVPASARPKTEKPTVKKPKSKG